MTSEQEYDAAVELGLRPLGAWISQGVFGTERWEAEWAAAHQAKQAA